LRGIFTNFCGIFISRVAGYVRDFTTASILGASLYSDIFFVAFKLPNLFRSIFAEGAFTQAFLPSFTAAKYKGAFSVYVFLRLFAIVVLISFIVTIFSHVVTTIIAVGFDEEAKKIAAPFVALNFWYLDFVFIITFLMALLHYRKHFAVPAFSTTLLNIAMIAALLIAKDRDQAAIVWSLSIGVLTGGALQLIAHLAALRGKRIIPMLWAGVRKKRDISVDTARFKKAFAPALFGASTTHISAFLDTLIASFLATGSISYLYYANRVFQLPLALFAIAVSMAVFPVISKMIKRGDEASAILMMSKNFWLLLYLLSISALCGFMLSFEIIWLLFERGAFVRADTLICSQALAIYLIGLVPFGLSRLFSLWLYSHHLQSVAARNSAYALGANIVLSATLAATYGVLGLALSGSLTGAISLLLNLRSFGWQRFWGIIRAKYFLLLAVTLLLEAGAIEAIKFVIDHQGF
jgi:putative peptidoglycan lipid II flippase